MAEKKRHRVLMVDDHPIVRQGLSLLINATDDLVICGEASTGREVFDLVDKCEPDVMIMDISLDDRNGLELMKEILLKMPGLPILALSMYDEGMYALRVLRAGGRGYIMKQESPRKLVGAIRQVVNGDIYLSEKMAGRLMEQVGKQGKWDVPVSVLSDREIEVLTLLARGFGAREIADKLYLSVKTIESHRERIKEKLNLKNATELLRYAIQFVLDASVTKP
jgi:DNA-binding NarL/FixJ family response regulator